LDWLNENWLEEALKSGKITIPHVQTEDGWVVTAPTRELQNMVLEWAADGGAFPPSADILRRMK
jgi:hypothetical protein